MSGPYSSGGIRLDLTAFSCATGCARRRLIHTGHSARIPRDAVIREGPLCWKCYHDGSNACTSRASAVGSIEAAIERRRIPFASRRYRYHNPRRQSGVSRFASTPTSRKRESQNGKKEGLAPARKRYQAGPLPSHLLDPKRTKGGHMSAKSSGAADRVRTGDLQGGNLPLFQLSYRRILLHIGCSHHFIRGRSLSHKASLRIALLFP